ncbi:5466_t:CDS:2, partial [Funneliformis geosporum]
NDLAIGYILTSQLHLYKTFLYSYDNSYKPEYDIPLRCASCERKFSLLSKLTNNKRLQLTVENLESI